MKKYITIIFIMVSFISCEENNKKIEKIKSKLGLCDSYKFFNKFEEINTKIVIDSLCFDKNNLDFYSALIKNNSDSVIVVKTMKTKYDTIFYLPFTYSRFYVDSFDCKVVASLPYIEIFEPKIKLNYLYPNEKLYVQSNNWLRYPNRVENVCFLKFNYYIGITKKEAITVSYFELKNGGAIKMY